MIWTRCAQVCMSPPDSSFSLRFEVLFSAYRRRQHRRRLLNDAVNDAEHTGHRKLLTTLSVDRLCRANNNVAIFCAVSRLGKTG